MLPAACNNTAANTDTGDAGTTVSDTAEETDIIDSFPAEDLGGMTYTIMSRPIIKADVNQIAPESMTGEIINDAVYRRNTAVEERFNVSIKWLECEENDYISRFTSSVMASEDSFQFAAIHVIQSGTLANRGLLADLNTIPNIDLSNPWWNQNAVESLTVNGKTYISQNDIPTYTVICNNHIMYFNRSLAEEYNIGDLYGLIRDGGWTLDRLYEYAGMVSSDLNGDSVMDKNDLWGLITTTGSTSIFLPSCNQAIMETGSDGLPALCLNTSKTAEIVGKIYRLCVGNEFTLMNNITFEVEYCKLFADSHSLFYNGYVADMNMMRDMEDMFGLIPPPKFDENQSEYYTLIQGNSDLVGIPSSLPEDKRASVGLVTEALAAVSYAEVRPAIYEGAIKSKYMRDTDSEEMLDMITRSIVVDFGFVYNAGFAFPIWDMMDKKSDNFASYYASKETAALAYYEDLLDTLQNADK